MTATAKIEIEIDVRSAKAVDSLEKLNASTRKAKAGTEDLTQGQGRLSGAFDKATAAMERAGAPLGKLQALMGAGGLIAAATGAAIAVDKLSQRSIALTDVNSNLRISLEAAKAAAGGLVSNYDLATNAATAMRFGVVKTSAEFARHVEIATKLARTTGQDSTKAVEDFTTALSRQSPMILDNLGLQVDVEKANAEYARSIGKTAAALTDAEKKQAFINAAYADAERKVAGLTVATDGWAISVQKAKVAAEDLGDDLLSLPKNIGELATEIQHATGVTDKWADRMVLVARGGLAALTLGGSEAYNVIELVNGSMASGVTQTQLWAKAVEDLTKKLTGVARVGEFSQGDLIRLVEAQKIQGLVMSTNARTIDALNYEKTQQYFADFDSDMAKANAKGGGRKKAESKADNGFADRAAISQWETLMGARDDSRAATKAQDELDFQTLDEKFELLQEEAAEAEEARIKRLEETRDAAARAAQERHDAEMARLKEQQERYERTGAAIGNTVAGLATTWLQAGDLSARGFGKALQSWGKAESIKMAGIAISEGVQSLVALATLNIPGAAAHAAAAAAAGAAAISIAALVGATGGFGGGTKNVKGFGGDAFGAGAAFEGSANDRPSTTNSQDDTVPVSASEEAMQRSGQANAAGARRTGGNVYHFAPGSIQTIGAIDDTTARKIAVGIKKAGDSGGRLTG
jgi:hypothetical protein